MDNKKKIYLITSIVLIIICYLFFYNRPITMKVNCPNGSKVYQKSLLEVEASHPFGISEMWIFFGKDDISGLGVSSKFAKASLNVKTAINMSVGKKDVYIYVKKNWLPFIPIKSKKITDLEKRSTWEEFKYNYTVLPFVRNVPSKRIPATIEKRR